MLTTISENSKKYLFALYENLSRNILLSNRKIVKGSVLLTIMKLATNDNSKLIRESTLNFSTLSIHDINPILNNGYASISNEISGLENIYISIKGIWYVEVEKGIIDVDKLLTYIQESKVVINDNDVELSQKERLIIFSLISMRTFTSTDSMSISDDSTCNTWLNLLLNHKIFLENLGIIQKNTELFEKKGYENPLRYLMRHANDLSKKTRNIFSSNGNYQYYLNITTNNKEKAKSELSYLLKKVFTVVSTTEMKDNIFQELRNSAHSDSSLVDSSFSFVSLEWDKIIKEALEDVYFL